MGTNENSKKILISHDITSEKRRKFERKRKKEKKKEGKDLVNRNQENKSENISQKI